MKSQISDVTAGMASSSRGRLLAKCQQVWLLGKTYSDPFQLTLTPASARGDTSERTQPDGCPTLPDGDCCGLLS